MQNDMELKTDVGRKLLQHSFVKHDMSQLIGRSRLEILSGLSAEDLVILLDGEALQTQAVVLAHIDARKSFETLEALPDKIRSQVLIRIAKLETIEPSLLDELNLSLMEKLEKLTSASG